MSDVGVWNPDQYERFKDERSRPFFDLLALVVQRPAMRVVDLGCGTGELTRVLHQQLAAAETVGIDSSASMLTRAATHAASDASEGLRFERAPIETWAPAGPLDVVFSNAALQWVPDHPALLARLSSMLGPNGQLAVQIPANEDHPSHRVAAEVAGEAPFREALGGYTRIFPNLTLPDYATALDRLGFRDPVVRMQAYVHRLPSSEDVVEWVKGTLLTDYARRMTPPLFELFVTRYREALRARLRESSEARPYPYVFKRIFFAATREA